MNPEDKMRKWMERAGSSSEPSEVDWQNFVGRAHRSLRMHRAVTAIGVVAVVALGAIGANALTRVTEPQPAPPAGNPTETTTPAPTESREAKPKKTETPPPIPEEIDYTVVELWFLKGERLYVEHEDVPAAVNIGNVAISTLILNRSGSDGSLRNLIPEGTEVRGLTIADGIATIDLSEEFAAPGGSLEEKARLAQVVFTLTQFPTVKGVNLEIEGEPITNYGSHGLVLDGPQDRDDFEDLSPAIIVETPEPGDETSSRIRVAGTANVFEANVSYRLLDDSGNEVDYRAFDAEGKPADKGYTTATSGSGTRGTFEFIIEVDVPAGTRLVLEVLEYSAEDGSPQNVVRVPITVTS